MRRWDVNLIWQLDGSNAIFRDGGGEFGEQYKKSDYGLLNRINTHLFCTQKPTISELEKFVESTSLPPLFRRTENQGPERLKWFAWFKKLLNSGDRK